MCWWMAVPTLERSNKYWLSILLPVYNVQPWLAECLGSILEQADAGVQILALDDASTDGSGALLQQWQQQWPERLQCLQHPVNQGLSAARNSLLDAAQGDYLWFIDSDDKLLPGAIDHLRTIVQKHTPDMVLCDFAVWREHLRLKHRLRGEQHRKSFSGPARTLLHAPNILLAGLLSAGQLHAWSKIARRTLWQQGVRFPLGRCFEDMTTIPLLALRAASFWYEPRPWVAYRQRTGSILSGMTAAKALDQSAALRPLAQALSGPLPSELALAFTQQCARNFQGAMRLRPTLPAAEQPAFVQQLRADFLVTAPLSPQQWLTACLQRGWWLRAGKFASLWRHT